MADDYDINLDDLLDYDDGWLYVDDEFDLADELAEGQLANPGYSGTAAEIAMEDYEFDLYGYWDDLEYADDAYWDYGLSRRREQQPGQKRKRGGVEPSAPGKRRKTTARTTETEDSDEKEAEPMLFFSREERNRLFTKRAPLQKGKAVFAFLADWRERFADADGIVTTNQMPADMKRAAEGIEHDPPLRVKIGVEDDDEEEEEGDWEDEEGDGDHGDHDALAIDPDMLKAILREKLGAAGLEGMDEDAFMRTIQKMMSGEGDDAASDLANALLGKVTSEAGNEAVSGWLSRQGVTLEDEDASNVATADAYQSSKGRARQATQTKQSSPPPDSAIAVSDVQTTGKDITQMPLHSGSPTTTSKKRAAPTAEQHMRKKWKKVKFDVPSDLPQAMEENDRESLASVDPLMSEPTIAEQHPTASKGKAANAAAAKANQTASENAEASSTKGTRKRKATSELDKKPARKKTQSRELESLGALSKAPSPAPPAKRTRSARAKSTK